MGKKLSTALKVIRICAMVLLLLLVAYVAVKIKNNPKLATTEGISGLVSDNLFLAVLEFWLMYLLKGISFIFPSSAINVAAGAVFGFPMSFLVSGIGILLEFLLLYFAGRFFGEGIIEWIFNKYPKAAKIEEINANSGIGLCFIIRILGLISYDVGSLYCGATKIRLDKFIIGSMLGAFFNITLANLVGQYILTPFCWQLWAVIAVRAIMIIIVFFAGKRKFEADRTKTE